MENMGKDLTDYMNRQRLNQRFNKLVEEALQDPDVQAFIQANQAALSQETVARSAAKIYEYVNEKKKILNGETTLAPGYAPKLVLSNHFIDVSYEPTADLVQKRAQAELKARVKSINMPKDIVEASLAQYDASERQVPLIEALKFVEAYRQAPTDFHQGLYLSGQFGVGKTYLLGAIANELALQGFETTLIHFPTFAVEMKNAIGQNNVLEKVNQIKKAPILMIDDIGADALSAWVRDEVLGIILQYRMQEQLATFFSSNFTMNELEKHLTTSQRGDEEPVKAGRIMQRVRYLASEVEVSGQNRRLQSN